MFKEKKAADNKRADIMINPVIKEKAFHPVEGYKCSPSPPGLPCTRAYSVSRKEPQW